MSFSWGEELNEAPSFWFHKPSRVQIELGWNISQSFWLLDACWKLAPDTSFKKTQACSMHKNAYTGLKHQFFRQFHIPSTTLACSALMFHTLCRITSNSDVAWVNHSLLYVSSFARSWGRGWESRYLSDGGTNGLKLWKKLTFLFRMWCTWGKGSISFLCRIPLWCCQRSHASSQTFIISAVIRLLPVLDDLIKEEFVCYVASHSMGIHPSKRVCHPRLFCWLVAAKRSGDTGRVAGMPSLHPSRYFNIIVCISGFVCTSSIHAFRFSIEDFQTSAAFSP